ncbi:hypothetical protein [Mesobacillus zeae]|uniref:Uncharacterized protein n=1 Tax=Mesobacillus zeae TaxID=1917180 RepID=A0A398B5D0_9BACI|nr:hypothetical protein [Mesobacillus zeae]RID85027.1 hypothetical protein D1970_10695 [Mesobacillus zeae]
MLVHNKGKYVRHAEEVMLVPGANQVESSDFERFSSHPLMKKLIDDGEIILQKRLKDMKPDDAIDLVKDTFSLAVLEEMKTVEKRKAVLEAIDSQAVVIQGKADESEE